MRPKDAQTVIMLSGAILIVGGLILIGAQFWIEVSLSADAPNFAKRGANLEAAGVTASVQTTYVGLVVLIVGAFLEVVGFIAARPWRGEAAPTDPAASQTPAASQPEERAPGQ
jgi:hypothetical protein